MHLFTRSARLSRSSRELPFSVLIQHSRAARERVIGSVSRTGSDGLAAWILGVSVLGAIAISALGASAAVGPVPSVEQAASASAQAPNSVMCAAEKKNLRVFIQNVSDFRFSDRW